MGSLLPFMGIALLVIAAPGQDTALTIRNTLRGGRRAGLATSAGIVLGQSVWALATSAGIGALIVASQPAFLTLRIAGAAYLTFLGVTALIAAVRGTASRAGGDAFRRTSLGIPTALRQGALSNLGNPKMVVFFLSLLPQFASTFTGLELHALLFSCMTMAWLTLYVLAIVKAKSFLLRPPIRRVLDTVTGLALVAFGVRLATERR
ncbi:MAG: LysE family translocator [Candidatus Dormibacteraeota bacterium]|nr:LysE family translocator [Candidatus Dormibacteraeota bacterium]MBV8445680.1 LysE family translocator [Candidatus Dormibacteraeota bacterium]